MAVLSFKANPYYFPGLVDFSDRGLWIAAASICFNPLYWNVVAQNEYRNKTITKLLGNRPYYGCYLLGASIFLLGILRDHLYNQALAPQPVHAALLHPVVKYGGGALFLAGQVLVLTSMYALGVTGTYLGDYFGILMDSMVTGFPFNVVPDPMYYGSSLCFAGVAFWFGKPAGLLLTALVVVVYAVALRFEGPFTSNIYAQAAKKKKKTTATTTTTRRSSSSTGTKRSSSTSSRRNSTAAKKDAAAANAAIADSPSTPAAAVKKSRRKSTATPKAAASSASDADSATPAKRSRKKKTTTTT